MPLVRIQLRNEYALGAQELYRDKNEEDPKALLEGVAVAGLVGILRQLGDLADFAADVFHGLQEQLVTTAARSHKMIVRVQHIEAALPQLEKAVLGQKSHIHFAYTAGCDWHPKIRTKQKHFIHSDLPTCIMDSYEECRDPPCLHLLDKFDTGGPGSCLRRYSDPTFFRKALASRGNSEKEQRERKVHKSKKKPSRRRNVQVSHAMPISQFNGSSPFSSPKSYGQSSVGDTISTIHTRSRSELGDRRTSLDSGSRSGYIECVFDAGSSIRFEDQEHNKLPTSMLMWDAGGNDSIPPDVKETGAFDYLAQGSFQESNSSYVTWDEKTEILKSENHQMDSTIEYEGDTAELLPASPVLGKLESKDNMLRDVDPEGVVFVGENLSDSLCDRNQFDEAASETDKYMDALNTLESEAETDSECQTKREVEEPLPNFQNEGMKCVSGVTDESIVAKSEFSPVKFEAEPSRSSNIQMSENLSNLISSAGLIHAHPPEISFTNSNPDIFVDTGYHESTEAEVPRVDDCESVLNDMPSSTPGVLNSEGPLPEKSISRLCESQESLQDISGVTSVQVWTNGGLLGLAPSKPPHYSALNVGNSTTVSQAQDNDAHDLSSGIAIPRSYPNGSQRELDGPGGTDEQIVMNLRSEGGRDTSRDIVGPNYCNMAQPIDSFNSSISYHDKQHNDMPEESATSKFRLEKYEDSCQSTNLTSHERDLTESSLVTPQVEQPVTSDIKIRSKEASQDIRSSSSMFSLDQKVSANGFPRKGSLVHDEKSEPLAAIKASLENLENSRSSCIGKKKVMQPLSPERNPHEQLQNGSPASSLSSSPPLEHMKISFHPIDGFETSKLKLTFPGGHHFHESIKDVIFPSFQLLPGPAIPLQDIDSESENDTFCRSSSYTSEELTSPRSDTSSEQWESGEVSTNKDPEIYDALHRVSSAGFISSGFELHEINNGSISCDDNFRGSDPNSGLKSFNCDPLFDLPSFDSVASTSQHKWTCADPNDNRDSVLQYPNEPMPAPPPLPPAGWWVTPHFEVPENEQGAISQVVDHPDKLHVLGAATPSQKFVPTPPKQPHIKELTDHLQRNKDQLRDGRGEAGNTANGKDMDGREDLLNQIRTKSFTLRRTIPSRPTVTPDPTSTTTNPKVAAIIQKANAIRQAYVGSDGGDDVNWSDG